MFNNGLWWGCKSSWFVASVGFHDANALIMADSKRAGWCDWTGSWEAMHPALMSYMAWRHKYWAHVLQLLKAGAPEPVLHNVKPLQWEARAPQLDSSLCSPKLEKWRHSLVKKKKKKGPIPKTKHTKNPGPLEIYVYSITSRKGTNKPGILNVVNNLIIYYSYFLDADPRTTRIACSCFEFEPFTTNNCSSSSQQICAGKNLYIHYTFYFFKQQCTFRKQLFSLSSSFFFFFLLLF